jgi:prephenate dehydrogenase
VATAAEAIRDAGLIILAAPPLACLELLDQLGGPLADLLDPDAVITDVASTKAAIVARAQSNRLRFVGGHPMAGRETAGYGAADPDLFRDRPWVIVAPEPPDESATERVRALAVTCGARPIPMTAAEHDAAVAAISHAPLAISVALLEAMADGPDWPSARRLAAGGWAGMTRLARGDAAMGAGIIATNASAIGVRLRAFRNALDDWIDVVDGAAQGRVDPAEVERRLDVARQLAVAADAADAAEDAGANAQALRSEP